MRSQSCIRAVEKEVFQNILTKVRKTVNLVHLLDCSLFQGFFFDDLFRIQVFQIQ